MMKNGDVSRKSLGLKLRSCETPIAAISFKKRGANYSSVEIPSTSNILKSLESIALGIDLWSNFANRKKNGKLDPVVVCCDRPTDLWRCSRYQQMALSIFT
jgi:hypothetical protein